MEKTSRRFLKIPELADALNCSRSRGLRIDGKAAPVSACSLPAFEDYLSKRLDRIASEATAGTASEPR